MKKFLHLPYFAFGIMLLTSCEKMDVSPKNGKNKDITTEVTPEPISPVIASATCEKTVSNFYAGQHILAGTITVQNDAINMYVTFHTEGGWVMQQTHLYVGPLSGLPRGASGNPKIGNFPYKQPHDPRVTDYTYTIPLSSLSSNCIIVAAHAEVGQISSNGSFINGETAWGAGNQISSGGSWASYFDYCICHPTVDGSGDGGSDGGGTSDGGSGGSGDGGSGDGGSDGSGTGDGGSDGSGSGDGGSDGSGTDDGEFSGDS